MIVRNHLFLLVFCFFFFCNVVLSCLRLSIARKDRIAWSWHPMLVFFVYFFQHSTITANTHRHDLLLYEHVAARYSNMWQAIYIRKKKQFIVKHVCFAKHRPHEHTNTQIHTHSRAHSHTNQTDIMYIIDIINMCMWLSVIKYNNTEIPCAHTYDSLIIIFYFHFDQYVHYNLKKC